MWRLIEDAREWDTALCALPWPHVLQSWAWGEFKSRWGWTAQRCLLTGDDGKPRAAIQLLRRSMGRWPLCVLYAPKGPVCTGLDAYRQSLDWLEQQARRQRAIWVKVDGDPSHNLLQQEGAGRDGALDSLRALLSGRGWRYSSAQIQFRNTLITDLRRSDQQLLAAMKPKCRYNTRLAEKRGVHVRAASPIDHADADLLYTMYAETAQRDDFTIRERDYYIDAWRAMNATALFAERDGEVLAALVLFGFAGRAWYFYGMSRSHGREHMPNHLLQWEAMRWARDHGCAIYDWWGAPDRLDESDSMWGVYRFKEGFSAQFVEGIGAWDYAPSPFLYHAYVKLGPRLIRSGLAG
jgi:lipid II:glycine glycyltransferase (peptidoglycan interpeptide bridge formation enzyme)